MKNDFEIRGEFTAIFLKYKSETLETLVDTSDLDRCKEYKHTWRVYFNKGTKSFYVIGRRDTKGSTMQLHRWLFEDNLDRSIMIDHINHNTLDNRRSLNLRKTCPFENAQNRKGATVRSKSGIRGVHWDSWSKKWIAQLQVAGKKMIIGRFDDKEMAKNAAIEARKKYMTHSDEGVM